MSDNHTQFAIPYELIKQLINYLKRRPYEDVNEFIAALMMAQPIEVLPPLPQEKHHIH